MRLKSNVMNFESLYSDYYDLMYADHPTSKECEYCEGLIQSQILKAASMLEFGCGTGRHGEFFEKSGHRWSGVELSKTMADKGIKKGLDIKVGNIMKPMVVQAKYDVVLSLFHVVSYCTTNSDVKTLFKNAYEHLNPGGLFVFDVWYTPAVLSLKPEKRTKEFVNDDIRVVRTANPRVFWNENLVEVNFDIQVFGKADNEQKLTTFKEAHLMRHFGAPEIRLFSELTNFEVIKEEEWLTGEALSSTTWGATFVLQKKS
ncbi:MAG TPA: hypothetical protein DCX14_05630 [Flavobacteriales bacterium]|nr:hypothetical protein [Flavobacteriales bacterium]